ncbi:ATP-binding protein [Alicyclobacillus acidocaldarius]|uniref:Magnesium chelatase ChlI subunit n=1 Tax=Alicyclobacillus acidocaldarius (strain Tc-4-1) TaxID=1048834 RepID=F8IHV2_ALIAT|nr:ATP-binding protein [Alicyclobacillus acidocaldarius]AEJ43242.1 magnesium chelatase ChlI subunit [Alicyclobacillus acidocaldarius subsp. acidocaldarius Tc-4-1]
MLGHAFGAIRHGADVQIVRVQADVGPGFPRFTIVGLPDSSVSEAKARVRSAFHHAGLPFPKGRITVNLQPASLKKQGSWLDLAIAVAILRASGSPPLPHDSTVFVAELALDGGLVPQEGLSAIGLRMRDEGLSSLCVSTHQHLPWPLENMFDLMRAATLADVVAQLRASRVHVPTVRPHPIARPETARDLPPLRGHPVEYRLLAICAAGRHTLLMVGSPGVGKTTLANAFAHLLPDLTEDEALEVAAWQEIANPNYAFTLRPPVRRPHHAITARGMLGGGRLGSPGEVTLAHRGVLLLDEMLEFSHVSLNALREPLDRGMVEVVVNGKAMRFPASFQLIATANPCPCGYRGYGDCSCPDPDVRRYWTRCPGPILDRIDVVHHVNRDLGRELGEASLDDWIERVRAATALLARVPDRTSTLSDEARRALRRACDRLHASERDRVKVAALATTIAALEGRDEVLTSDVEEAMIWRRPGSLSPMRNAIT